MAANSRNISALYLLLNSTAALHTSALCPSLISSGKDSSSGRGGRSFTSRWISKVDLMLHTAGREDMKKTTVSTASIVVILKHSHSLPTQLLLLQ